MRDTSWPEKKRRKFRCRKERKIVFINEVSCIGDRVVLITVYHLTDYKKTEEDVGRLHLLLANITVLSFRKTDGLLLDIPRPSLDRSRNDFYCIESDERWGRNGGILKASKGAKIRNKATNCTSF